MIQMESYLRIMDNSGGIIAKCVKVYKKKIGIIGDKILVSLQKMKAKKINAGSTKTSVENHQMYKALIIQTKKGFVRKDNRIMKFKKNKIILLSRNQEKLIGTRILGLVAKEFRNKKYMKLLTISSRSI
jgi:large subunit ribosomal protein L14